MTVLVLGSCSLSTRHCQLEYVLPWHGTILHFCRVRVEILRMKGSHRWEVLLSDTSVAFGSILVYQRQ